jgi:hypothetical protein
MRFDHRPKKALADYETSGSVWKSPFSGEKRVLADWRRNPLPLF